MKSYLLALTLILVFVSCDSNSKTFKDLESEFEIMFPQAPEESSKEVNYESSKIIVHSYSYKPDNNDKNLEYNLISFDLPKVVTDSINDDNLNESLNSFNSEYSTTNYSTVSLYQISTNGFPGMEYRMIDSTNGMLMRNRIFLVENRLYILSVKTKKENIFNPGIRTFLESFKLLKKSQVEKDGDKSIDIKSYYSIDFPGTTYSKTINSPSLYGNITGYGEFLENKNLKDTNLLYTVSLNRYSYNFSVSDTFNIDEFYENFKNSKILSMQAELLEYKKIDLNGVKGVEFALSFKNSKYVMRTRTFLKNENQYVIMVLTVPKLDNNAKMLRFFNSFVIKK